MTELPEPMETEFPAGSAPAGTAPDPAPGVPEWSAGLDPDSQRLVRHKGWRSAADAVKSYGHLERLLGERVALPPADAPLDALYPVLDRLGRPARAEDYAFTVPEALAATPEAYSSELADGFRQIAHRAGLTAAQAGALHDWFVQSTLEAGATALPGEATAGAGGPVGSETDAEMEADAEAELRQGWGGRYEAQMAASRRAAHAFAGEALAGALEQAAGKVAVRRMFARIGAVLGEDQLVDGGGGAGPASAQAEIRRLMADPRFQSAWLDAGHPEHDSAITRLHALHRRS